MPSFIAVLRGPHFRFELANDHFRTLVGRDDITGRTLLEAWPALDGQPLWALLRRVWETGQSYESGEAAVLLTRGRDGGREECWLDVGCLPQKDLNGTTVGILLHGVDVTSRRTREAELIRLNRTLRALGASSQAMTRGSDETAYLNEVCQVVVRHCGHAMVWIGFARNDAAKSVQPVAQSGFDGGYIEQLRVTWSDTELGRGPTGTAIRTGRPSVCRNMQTDPSFAPWRAEALKRGYASSLVVPLLAEGRAFGAICFYSPNPDAFTAEEVRLLSALADDVSYGITALRVRQANVLAERSLLEREHELAAIYENAPIIILLLDGERRVRKSNKEAETYAGQTADDLFGRSAGEVLHCRHVTDDARGCGYGPSCRNCVLRNAVATTVTTGEGQRHLEVTVPVTAECGDCNRTFLLSSLRLELRGQPMALVTMQDITQRKRVEEELRSARRAAESANRAKDHFLAVLSHELRTPLTPVLTTTEMLEADPALSSEHQDMMGMIRRNIELEARLIDDLLDLTRIVHQKLELHFEAIDVHEKIADTLRICSSEIAVKQLRVTTEFRAGASQLCADPARFQQVIWNVVKNAVKFTPPSGRIAITTRNLGDGGISIEVADTGAGIAPEALPRIFAAFEQGGSEITRQFGGLGLGLAISQALVQAHRGRITASSAGPGKGATFTVWLPLGGEAAVHGSQSTAARPGKLSCTILLTEDHGDTLRALTGLFRRIGCTVLPAANAAEALKVAATESFDLLVTDLGLPDATGIELAQQLKSRHEVPCIALSGYGMDEDLAKTKAAGFAAHLRKPVRFSVLEQTVREVMSQSRRPPAGIAAPAPVGNQGAD